MATWSSFHVDASPTQGAHTCFLSRTSTRGRVWVHRYTKLSLSMPRLHHPFKPVGEDTTPSLNPRDTPMIIRSYRQGDNARDTRKGGEGGISGRSGPEYPVRHADGDTCSKSGGDLSSGDNESFLPQVLGHLGAGKTIYYPLNPRRISIGKILCHLHD